MREPLLESNFRHHRGVSMGLELQAPGVTEDLVIVTRTPSLVAIDTKATSNRIVVREIVW